MWRFLVLLCGQIALWQPVFSQFVALRLQQSVGYRAIVLDVWNTGSQPQQIVLPTTALPSKGLSACTLAGYQTEGGGDGMLTLDITGTLWFGCRNVSVNASLSTNPAPMQYMYVPPSLNATFPYATTSVFPNGTNTLQILNGGNNLYSVGGGSPTLNNQAIIRTDSEAPLIQPGPVVQSLFTYNTTLFAYAYVRTNGAIGLRVPAILQLGAPGRLPSAPYAPVTIVRTGTYMYGSVVVENQASLWYMAYVYGGPSAGGTTGGYRIVKENLVQNTTELFGLPAASSGSPGGQWLLQTGRYERGDFAIYVTNGATIQTNTYLGLRGAQPYRTFAIAPSGWSYRGLMAYPSPSMSPIPTVSAVPSASSTRTPTGTLSIRPLPTLTATLTGRPLPSQTPSVSARMSSSPSPSAIASVSPAPSKSATSSPIPPSVSPEAPSQTATPSPIPPSVSPEAPSQTATPSPIPPSTSPEAPSQTATSSGVPSVSDRPTETAVPVESVSSSSSSSVSASASPSSTYEPVVVSISASGSVSWSSTMSGTVIPPNATGVPAAANENGIGALPPSVTIGASVVGIAAGILGIGFLLYKIQFMKRMLRNKKMRSAVVQQNPLSMIQPSVELGQAPVYRPGRQTILIVDELEPAPPSRLSTRTIFAPSQNTTGYGKKEFTPVLSSRSVMDMV